MSGPDPKPRKRVVGSRAWWTTQQTRKTGCCVLCRRKTRTSWHHLVERSLGGDDVEGNLAELCGDGTRGCHGEITGWKGDARWRLRRILNNEQIGYITQRKGQYWLDRYYPGATTIWIK